MVPRDRIELPTRGFSDLHFKNPNSMYFKHVVSTWVFSSVFGFVWKCFVNFDLDGHNLGTGQNLCLFYFPTSKSDGFWSSDSAIFPPKNSNQQKKIIVYFKFYQKKDVVCMRVAGNVLYELLYLANHIKHHKFCYDSIEWIASCNQTIFHSHLPI